MHKSKQSYGFASDEIPGKSWRFKNLLQERALNTLVWAVISTSLLVLGSIIWLLR